MNLVVQPQIKGKLQPILAMISKTGKPVHFLFRGPSGYGKTELASHVTAWINGKFSGASVVPYTLGDKAKLEDFSGKWKAYFIDEIHLCQYPEMFYPLMDRWDTIFVFATNFDSKLPEAFSNRCQSFVFSRYTTEQLRKIFREHFPHLKVGDGLIDWCAELADYNPRILLREYGNTIDALNAWYDGGFVRLNEDQQITLLCQRLGIKDNLPKLHQDYLQALKEAGGRASLPLLTQLLHLDELTIKYQIEPKLLKRGLIKISSKGRQLC
jgi:Holliday junction resolvasome RuvABC ATP-dependent DNA helicase subunit